jgi:hypothetical protein
LTKQLLVIVIIILFLAGSGLVIYTAVSQKLLPAENKINPSQTNTAASNPSSIPSSVTTATKPSSPHIIEPKWETGGPSGERPRLSGGIQSLYIFPSDKNKARALEEIGPGDTLLSWNTEDGGQSWRKGEIKLSEITKEEKASFESPFHLEGTNNPDWWGWKNLTGFFPLNTEYTHHPFHIFESTDHNNSSNVLVSVLIRDALANPTTFDSRLFFTQDHGKIWKEIKAPPSSWKGGLKIEAVALISADDYFKIYVGLSHTGNLSVVWQTQASLR